MRVRAIPVALLRPRNPARNPRPMATEKVMGEVEIAEWAGLHFC